MLNYYSGQLKRGIFRCALYLINILNIQAPCISMRGVSFVYPLILHHLIQVHHLVYCVRI